ncbi:hypothetical protein Pmani_024529 [Petrolisthes manimaculis]|uniref:Uncharacterized protein n=1 Tax=Petrolisthes manimaculis TaxID=1843537 RepID=A0AAE1P8J4_9EUCA|nr:hypothetical protein Pmani_024529 [Petrolisthes manimaculis]
MTWWFNFWYQPGLLNGLMVAASSSARPISLIPPGANICEDSNVLLATASSTLLLSSSADSRPLGGVLQGLSGGHSASRGREVARCDPSYIASSYFLSSSHSESRPIDSSNLIPCSGGFCHQTSQGPVWTALLDIPKLPGSSSSSTVSHLHLTAARSWCCCYKYPSVA